MNSGSRYCSGKGDVHQNWQTRSKRGDDGSAILLVAEDKRGEWSRWYKDVIPLAEERYKTYLADRAEEEEEGT